MKRLLIVGCAVMVLSLAGCAGVSPNTVVGTPMMGWIYSDMKYPHPRTEVVNDGVGTKHGEAMAKNILGLVAVGDASIEAAMKSSNPPIKKVYTVDHHVMSIFGVYTEWKTLITGE